MTLPPASDLINDIAEGQVVPYLGPGVLRDVHDLENGEPMPADSDSLILAMNNGQPMALRLMYEFPRAAMHLENKKGRRFIEAFLTRTYTERNWSTAAFHQWLAAINPRCVIDINRDTQLQSLYARRPHNLVVGLSRMAGNDYRYRLFTHNGRDYQPIEPEQVDSHLPLLFKPMGTPLPEPLYVASDADFVDYITELMGGFAIPAFHKLWRRNRRYLFIGMRFTRDTERMVVSDMIHDAAEPAGWALIPDATDKERRYCRSKNIEVVDSDWQTLLQGAAQKAETVEA